MGESRSDYDIFTAILTRLGLGAVFTEGCGELDWVKRVFDSSDLPDHISWRKFCSKGYFVVPPENPELRQPVDMRWFAEGRRKDVPEPHPLPSQWAEEFGMGLQTPSGKLEFVPEILKRNTADNPDRPPLNRYMPSWEGLRAAELVERYPLQMIATHSRYSFHTYADGKNSAVSQVEDHRALIAGHRFWLLRLNPADAAARGIGHRDLVKIFNDRGAVICAADISPLVDSRRRQVLRGQRRVQARRGRGRNGRDRRLSEHAHPRPAANPGDQQHGPQFLPGAGREVAGRRRLQDGARR